MKKNKRNLVILFFNMAGVMLSFGINIPILPFGVERFGGGGLGMVLVPDIGGLSGTLAHEVPFSILVSAGASLLE